MLFWKGCVPFLLVSAAIPAAATDAKGSNLRRQLQDAPLKPVEPVELDAPAKPIEEVEEPPVLMSSYFPEFAYTHTAKVGGELQRVNCDANWGPQQESATSIPVKNGFKCWVHGSPSCKALYDATFYMDWDGQTVLPADRQTSAFPPIKEQRGFKIFGGGGNLVGATGASEYDYTITVGTQNDVKTELTGPNAQASSDHALTVTELADYEIKYAKKTSNMEDVTGVIIKGSGDSGGAVVYFGEEWKNTPMEAPKFENSLSPPFKYEDIEYIEFCVGVDIITTGDPHLKRFDGSWYDYHGACDLLLLDNPNFNNGQGLQVQIRTKIVSWWSYIDQLVIKLGDDVFQTQGGVGKQPYWLNGEKGQLKHGGKLPFTVGGFSGRFRQISDNVWQYKFFLPNDQVLRIRSNKFMLQFDIQNVHSDDFGASRGLLGRFTDGAMMARNGTTVINDPNEFGQEWQVLETETNLFMERQGPQHPEQCVLPAEKMPEVKRRLLASSTSRTMAEEACAGAHPDEFENCVTDVLTLDDVDIADGYILDGAGAM